MTFSRSNKEERPSLQDASYLQSLGDKVRAARARNGMTRKILAAQSGVSERYLAQLETGRGNVSVLVLRQIATAMGLDIVDLLSDRIDQNFEAKRMYQDISRLTPDQVEQVQALIQQKLALRPATPKGRRIALIGLRGAGKSTLGLILAEKLGFKFVELNAMVEKEFGAGLGELFSLAGQSLFRRLERRCLLKLIEDGGDYVIATGGSIVADDETYAILLRDSFTVWLQTSPEEHMSRVVNQGDMRPMAGNREAMQDLKQILASRSPLYEKAHAKMNSSGQSEGDSLQTLHELVSSRLEDNFIDMN